MARITSSEPFDFIATATRLVAWADTVQPRPCAVEYRFIHTTPVSCWVATPSGRTLLRHLLFRLRGIARTQNTNPGMASALYDTVRMGGFKEDLAHHWFMPATTSAPSPVPPVEEDLWPEDNWRELTNGWALSHRPTLEGWPTNVAPLDAARQYQAAVLENTTWAYFFGAIPARARRVSKEIADILIMQVVWDDAAGLTEDVKKQIVHAVSHELIWLTADYVEDFTFDRIIADLGTQFQTSCPLSCTRDICILHSPSARTHRDDPTADEFRTWASMWFTDLSLEAAGAVTETTMPRLFAAHHAAKGFATHYDIEVGTLALILSFVAKMAGRHIPTLDVRPAYRAKPLVGPRQQGAHKGDILRAFYNCFMQFADATDGLSAIQCTAANARCDLQAVFQAPHFDIIGLRNALDTMYASLLSVLVTTATPKTGVHSLARSLIGLEWLSGLAVCIIDDGTVRTPHPHVLDIWKQGATLSVAVCGLLSQ